MANIQRQCSIRARPLRLIRLLLLLLVLLLSSTLHYPDLDYSFATAGAELFWALMQVVDMDCGNSPEISLTTHACLDISTASISLGMMLQLSLCITRPGLDSIYYWWTMISWGGLA
ncbi:hypothetical protein F4813DRAFT_391990 [Daldinia decipiens]|uniref:uncharacterized protein n=1 Tax=Daldinia decipiens TaxID=326647 RepID=UPI0020C25A2E|nr:uncharacterized protein F4813DRAFT_391990 [Daldinia decipiens]KAI1655279.1 hypothetical protein F4813DRAFT_391990 [Daldinia decipiens]